jgi:hypothetical protein
MVGRSIICAIIIMHCLLPIGSSAAQSSSLFRDEGDMLARLRQLEQKEYLDNCTFEVIDKFQRPYNEVTKISSTAERTTRHKVSLKSGSLNIESTSENADGKISTSVYTRTQDMQFMLNSISTEKKHVKSDDFVLRGFSDNKKLQDMLKFEKEQLGTKYPIIMPLTSCTVFSIRGLLSDFLVENNFKILSQVVRDGKLVVDLKIGQLYTAHVVFPAIQSPIATSILITETGGVRANQYEYRIERIIKETTQGSYVCEKIHSTYISLKENKVLYDRDLVFQNLKHELVPDSTFSIEEYNLPSPIKSPIQNRTSLPAWLAIGAIFLTVLAFYFRARSRSRDNKK